MVIYRLQKIVNVLSCWFIKGRKFGIFKRNEFPTVFAKFERGTNAFIGVFNPPKTKCLINNGEGIEAYVNVVTPQIPCTAVQHSSRAQRYMCIKHIVINITDPQTTCTHYQVCKGNNIYKRIY